MKTSVLCFSALLLIATSCSESFNESKLTNPNITSNKGQFSSGNQENIQATLDEQGTTYKWTDVTGTISLIMYQASVKGNVNHLSIQVADSSYVIVGGGASVWDPNGSYNFTPPGAMLTESRPDFANNAWVGSSKDHLQPYYHTLLVQAVGMKLNGVTANQLRSYMFVASSTSSLASHPTAGLALPGGYIMLGGGAFDNWSGVGNLLVASYPISNIAWWTEGKDHLQSSPATITAYVIGIPSYIPGFGSLAGLIGHGSVTVPSAYARVDI